MTSEIGRDDQTTDPRPSGGNAIKTLVLIVVLGVVGAALYMNTGSVASGEAPSGFVAGGEISRAVEEAGQSGKPIFVVASATWCGPCQHYKANTLTDQSTREMLTARTVPVYVDVDTDRDAVAFLNESGAQFSSIPFTAMIKDGRVVGSFSGAYTPQQLSQWIAEHGG